jgi:hypothetical protein
MKILIVLVIASFASILSFAQTTTGKKTTTTTTTTSKKAPAKAKPVQAKYACPMHPDVTSTKPGECSKCGMALTKVVKTYTCSMHPEVVSDKPGKCPKCKMDLTEALFKTKAKKA